MDVLPWISTLPFVSGGDEWSLTDVPPFVLRLVSSGANSILFTADYTADAGTDVPTAVVTFAVYLQGPKTKGTGPVKPIWTSVPCPLPAEEATAASANYPFLRPFLLQLLQEVLARAPYPGGNNSACLPPLTLDDVDGLLDGSESSTGFFALVFLCRLFWMCACDSTTPHPFDTGALFFKLFVSDLPRAISSSKPAMRAFFLATGSDIELAFGRGVGYMLTKWCILRDLTAPSSAPAPTYGISYAADLHGLWVVRGYAPVPAMGGASRGTTIRPLAALASHEPVLRYALAHQQLETVVQLEYAVRPLNHRYLQVSARVDNIRARVARLGFAPDKSTSSGDVRENESVGCEMHFPSRVRVCAGPDPSSVLSRRVAALSLGRSTGNPEREVGKEQTLRGSLFAPKTSKGGLPAAPELRAESRAWTRAKSRCWRWEQDAEGNMAVFEGVLCDATTGTEVADWRGSTGGGASGGDPRGGMRRRCSGARRAFGKSGGVVVAGDEIGEWVSWRVAREAEGKVMRWRLGVKVWVSYSPNEVRSEMFETRSVEWKEDVELPLAT